MNKCVIPILAESCPGHSFLDSPVLHPSPTDEATCSPIDFICLVRKCTQISESFTSKFKQPSWLLGIAFID